MYLWCVKTINVTYRQELATTFHRLFDKRNALVSLRPFSQSALKSIQEALLIEWTYNSNSIEGNTLNLRETQMVLQHGVTIKGKSLKEHFEAKNHEDAINKLFKLVNSNYVLNSKDILGLHSLVLRAIEQDFAGRLRNGAVRIAGANFIPPNANKVHDLLEELILFVNDNPQQLNVIELATVFHHEFVFIHPFFDGNGRTVRLVMNLLLMKEGFPPAIILANDRKKYYSALNMANKGQFDKLILLICQTLERSLNIYLSAFPDSHYNYQSISDVANEPDIPYSQEYISLLARQGKIDAHKEGRNWVTTKTAVINYINSISNGSN